MLSIGRLQVALGDGATREQARAVLKVIESAGLLETAPQIVGLAEIATRCGVTNSAVCQWPGMPEPLARLKSGRVWDWRQVEAYLRATKPGMLP
jgi:hypothetical protein